MSFIFNNGLIGTLDYCPADATLSNALAAYHFKELLKTATWTHVASNDGTNVSNTAGNANDQVDSGTEYNTNQAYWFGARPAITAGIGYPGNDIIGLRRHTVSHIWSLYYVPALTGGLLYKTGGGSAWNAGASSVQTAAGDCQVDIMAESTANTGPIIGLSTSDPDADYATIKYGLYLNVSGQFHVYESGIQKYISAANTYRVGDVFTVKRVGSTITYLRNGQLFYTSAATETGTLMIDSSIFTVGAFSRVWFTVAGVKTAITWQNATNVSAQIAGRQSIVTNGTTTTIPIWPIMQAIRGTLPDTAPSQWWFTAGATRRYSFAADNAAPYGWYFFGHPSNGLFLQQSASNGGTWMYFDIVTPESMQPGDVSPVVMAAASLNGNTGGPYHEQVLGGDGSAIATGGPVAYWRKDLAGEVWAQTPALALMTNVANGTVFPGGAGVSQYGALNEVSVPFFYGTGGVSGRAGTSLLQGQPCGIKGRSYMLGWRSAAQPMGWMLKRQFPGDRAVFGDLTVPWDGNGSTPGTQLTFT